MEYPIWLQVVLALSMSVSLIGLGAWMFCTSAAKAIKAANKLEIKRANRETEALDNWKQAYDAEHTEHLQDVADLINKLEDERYLNAENMKEADRTINDLLRKIREKDALLKLAKVADL